MSRASDVRDDVITALQAALPAETVEAFIVPSYTREELVNGARICVRYGAREVRVDQGPDNRDIVIEVGVVGVTPPRDDTDYRTTVVDKCDEFDELMDSVIGQWSPNGPLSKKTQGMANHRFVELTQAIQFDPQKLYDEGIWLSMIQLTYRDAVDD